MSLGSQGRQVVGQGSVGMDGLTGLHSRAMAGELAAGYEGMATTSLVWPGPCVRAHQLQSPRGCPVDAEWRAGRHRADQEQSVGSETMLAGHRGKGNLEHQRWVLQEQL